MGTPESASFIRGLSVTGIPSYANETERNQNNPDHPYILKILSKDYAVPASIADSPL
jgi:hypothetical protein